MLILFWVFVLFLIVMFGRFKFERTLFCKPCCTSLLLYVLKRIGWRCCGGHCSVVPCHG
jgi:hypothetical protein